MTTRTPIVQLSTLAIKVVVVVVALGILALGMTVIGRRAGRARKRPDRADDTRPIHSIDYSSVPDGV